MVMMASTQEEQDRKIVLEFIHLLEKSKQLFNGLRFDLTFPVTTNFENGLLYPLFLTEIYLSMVTDNGRHTLDAPLMCTRNCGSFNSNIEWSWTLSTDLSDGKLAKSQAK